MTYLACVCTLFDVEDFVGNNIHRKGILVSRQAIHLHPRHLLGRGNILGNEPDFF